MRVRMLRISVGADRARALGLKQVPTIKLSRGKNGQIGVSHNWKHHKEMFTDLADSQRVMEETIGNPNARCVLSLMPPTDIGVKRVIVIHNPDTGCRLGKICPSNLGESLPR